MLDKSRADQERALLTEETERTGNHVEDAIGRRGERLARTLGLIGAPLALFFSLLGLQHLAKPVLTGEAAPFAWGWKSLRQMSMTVTDWTGIQAPSWLIAAVLSLAFAAFLWRATYHGWSRRKTLAFGVVLSALLVLAMPAWKTMGIASGSIMIFATLGFLLKRCLDGK